MAGTTVRRLWPLFLLPVLLLVGLLAWWLPAIPLAGALSASLLGAVALCVGPLAFAAAALLFALCGAVSASFLYGASPVLGAGLCLLPAVPALLCLCLARKKFPFFQLAQVLGFGCLFLLLGAYAGVYLLAGDPIRLVTDAFAETLASMPEEVETLLLLMASALGLVSGGELLQTGSATAAQLMQMQTELVSYVELSYRLGLPTLFVSWAVYNATLSSFLPIWAASAAGREGLTPPPDITRIRIPRKVNLGMLAAVVVCWLLSMFASASMVAVSQAVWELVLTLYAVQGLSVSEWFLRKKNVHPALRALILAAGLLFLRYALFFIGLLEQLLCFRGIDKPQLPGPRGPED